MRRWPRLIAALIPTLILLACAQGTAPREGSFPTPRELDQLRQKSPSESPFPVDVLDVPAWELEGPLADRLGATPRAPASVWDGFLAEAVARREGLVLATEEMHCLAREIGRFTITHRRQPTSGLLRFIAARCGVPSAAVSFGRVQGPAPESFSEDRLLEQWRSALSGLTETQLAGGPHFVGIWFGRQEEHGVAIVAATRREVRVEPVATVLGEDRRFVLRGEVLVPASQLQALVNRGPHQVAECVANPEVVLPGFEFECEAARGDSTSWVAISLFSPGRVLGRPVLEILLRAPGERADLYRRPAQIASLPAGDPERLPELMTVLVNRLRREADIAPLQLAPEQSQVASELAPHFFSALFDQTKQEFLDLVLLGMMAGWRVEGIIQRSQVSYTWVSESDDIGRLLAAALDHPVSRQTLMDPHCEKIAIGALARESGRSIPALTALIATYAMFSEASHAEMQAEILERFTRARAERGLGPPDRLPELDAVVVDAASRVEAGEEPRRALSRLIDESVEVLQRVVNGWVFEVTDLDQLEFPQDFLDRQRLGLAIGVSHHQPEGEPWGRYVVMLVAAEPEHRTAARRPKDGLAPL